MKSQRSYLSKLFLVLGMLMGYLGSWAQEKPPVPIEVEVDFSQALNFGTFTVNSAGRISVSPEGGVITSGGIQRLNIGDSPSAALFDVYVNQGTIVSIQAPMGIILEGSNGGTLNLEIDSFSRGQMFVATDSPPKPNAVYVGGTLIIDSAESAEAGYYAGSFTLTFIHE